MQEFLIVCLIVSGFLIVLTFAKIWITRSERVLSIQSAHQFSNLEKRIADLEARENQAADD